MDGPRDAEHTVSVIRVKRIAAGASRLMDPGAREWVSAPEEVLGLSPTPILSQPSLYVQTKWKDGGYGGTPSVRVRAAHDGSTVFFRLSWDDDTKDDAIDDSDRFADAAAVLFPVKDDAPLTSMGSPEQPVNAWLWRADLEAPFNVTAQGIGTAVRSTDPSLASQASYANGGWSVVVSRALQGTRGTAQLKPGQRGKVAFGVWQGSNAERAGLKAVTLEWQELEIEG